MQDWSLWTIVGCCDNSHLRSKDVWDQSRLPSRKELKKKWNLQTFFNVHLLFDGYAWLGCCRKYLQLSYIRILTMSKLNSFFDGTIAGHGSASQPSRQDWYFDQRRSECLHQLRRSIGILIVLSQSFDLLNPFIIFNIFVEHLVIIIPIGNWFY